MKTKKTCLFFILCLIFLFAACSNEDVADQNDREVTIQNLHLFGVKQLDSNISTKGVSQSPKLWNRLATVRVKFLNGSQENQEKVKAYADEWLQHIQLKFQFVESGETEVRISFEGDEDPINRYVTWSYTGTDCKKVSDQNLPTANLAFFDYISEEDQKAETLRLFGQILGLEFEHRHLKADPKWNKNKNLIKNYWEGNITDIPWGELEQYVFAPFENTDIIIETEEFDPTSIMLWAFPRNIATSPDFWYSNYELSEKDIEFIKFLYGEKEDNMELALEMVSHGTHVRDVFNLWGIDTLFVDWGWGDAFCGYVPNLGSPSAIWAKFPSDMFPPIGGNYTTKLYFSSKELTKFQLVSFNISSIDLSKCTNLEDLGLSINPNLYYLDLSKNTKLISLNLQANSFSEIDFSNNINLEKLTLFRNVNLKKLDVSNNKKLHEIHIHTSPFLQNRESLIAFANSLPDNNSYRESGIRVSKRDSVSFSWIKDICDSKNWKISLSDYY